MSKLNSNEIADLFLQRLLPDSFQMRVSEKQVAWLLGQFRRENPEYRQSNSPIKAEGHVGNSANRFWQLSVFPNGAGILNTSIVDNSLVYDRLHPEGVLVGGR